MRRTPPPDLIGQIKKRMLTSLPVTHIRPFSGNHSYKYPASERNDVTHQKPKRSSRLISPPKFDQFFYRSSPFTFHSVFLNLSNRTPSLPSKSVLFLIGNKILSYPVPSDPAPNTIGSSRHGPV
ncbi:hypothetical protein TNCV_1402161 [Trichonephila clavipes]|nr:hypothetical protein TNCV_1402161 [Trichonephila clavipes]